MAVSGVNSQYVDWAQEIISSLAKQREADDSDAVAEDVVKDLDKDGDSTLNRKESGLSQSLFSAADADGDGKINVQELADALAAERAMIMAGVVSESGGETLIDSLSKQLDLAQRMEGVAKKFLAVLDKDGDSALSLKESGLSKEVFNSVDADNDGVISGEELADALASERQDLMSGATSNAGGASLFDSLLRQAGLNVALKPRQLRKALQAYGSNILVSALAENDADSNSLFSSTDFLNNGQARLLGLIDATSADSTDSDLSMGLAGLLDSSI